MKIIAILSRFASQAICIELRSKLQTMHPNSHPKWAKQTSSSALHCSLHHTIRHFLISQFGFVSFGYCQCFLHLPYAEGIHVANSDRSMRNSIEAPPQLYQIHMLAFGAPSLHHFNSKRNEPSVAATTTQVLAIVVDAHRPYLSHQMLAAAFMSHAHAYLVCAHRVTSFSLIRASIHDGAFACVFTLLIAPVATTTHT